MALAAFAVGALFSVGLGIAGMTQPAKVVGFLDVTGDWDPSLMFVLAGATMTYMLVLPLVLKRGTPLLGERFQLPTRRDITGRLVLGSTLFGLGWGLGGYCPGPAITSLPSGTGSVSLFVAAMVTGMVAVSAWDRSKNSGRRPWRERFQRRQQQVGG